MVEKYRRDFQMKECPYCGLEYPDAATVCTVDETPLEPLKPKSPTRTSGAPVKPTSSSLQRILFAGCFAILSGLCGMGLVWLIVGTVANHMGKDQGIALISTSLPKLLVGGVLGFLAGLVGFLVVVKPDKKSMEAAEKKFVGRRGEGQIYMGAPFSLFLILSILLFDRLENMFSTKTAVYTLLVGFLAIVFASLWLLDRIPRKCIIPIGIVGWAVSLSLAVWFGFHSP